MFRDVRTNIVIWRHCGCLCLYCGQRRLASFYLKKSLIPRARLALILKESSFDNVRAGGSSPSHFAVTSSTMKKVKYIVDSPLWMPLKKIKLVERTFSQSYITWATVEKRGPCTWWESRHALAWSALGDVRS